MSSGITGVGLASSQLSLQQVQEARTLDSVRSGAAPTTDDKIKKGSTDFEAMLLSTWLQQAEKSFATVPGTDDEEDAAGRDQMMSLGTQTLAQSMAASGGIGLGSMIAHAMHRTADAAQAAAAGEKSGKS